MARQVKLELNKETLKTLRTSTGVRTGMMNATNSCLHCPAPSNACGNGGSDVPSNKWECLLF